MILSGEKKEEYRALKIYWYIRFMVGNSFQEYDAVRFRNGYSPTAPEMTFELIKFRIGYARPEWSNNMEGMMFVIELGNRIEMTTESIPPEPENPLQCAFNF